MSVISPVYLPDTAYTYDGYGVSTRYLRYNKTTSKYFFIPPSNSRWVFLAKQFYACFNNSWLTPINPQITCGEEEEEGLGGGGASFAIRNTRRCAN